MKLYHKVLPDRVDNEVLVSIRRWGLLPRLPCEYKLSLPVELREVPIVWLTESMNTMDGAIFSVNVKMLDKRKLHRLNWDDVAWWVYEGVIPPEAVEPLMEV